MCNKKLLSDFKQYISETQAIEKELNLSEIETYELYSETAEDILKDFMLWKTDRKTWENDWRK